MVAYRVIGKPTPRVEGVDKVTGQAHYAADIALPGMLWAKALRSPYSHARIIRVDTTAARALPGVHAVLTGDDVHAGLYGGGIKDIPALAIDKVRFFGEKVAAVAADDEETAERACELIEVEYEELPAVFDPLEAAEADAPLVHPDYLTYPGARQESHGNVFSHTKVDRGDLDQGFAEADFIVENTYTTSRQHQLYLEPQAALVNIEGDEVQLWTCSKAPYRARGSLAAAIQLPVEKVVFNHTYIGGDFGGKGVPQNLPIAYFLAKASGRPIMMVLDYVEELMAGNPRHSTVCKLRTGVKNDGTLTAHHVQFYVDSGAYAGFKPGGTIGGANQAAGAYRVANTRIESLHVYTNTLHGGHMRSPGEPQGVFAIESHVDEIARRLGMDPYDFRMKNLVSDGDTLPTGERPNDLRARETLEAAAEASHYQERRPRYVGKGIAIGDRPPGGGEGSATVTLKPDGSVVLGTPIFDQGTGTYTTLVQIVSEELQVPMDRIAIEVWKTGAVDNDSGIGGMRATRINTAVGYEVAQDTIRELFAFAADKLGWPAEKLVLRGDEVRRTDQEEAVRWPELLSRFEASVSGSAHVEENGRAPITSFAVQIAEVEVDPETGQVTLLNFTSAHDVGRVLNPIGHQGQINGGVMQGVGYALMEEMRMEDGRVTNLSLGDYKVPTIADIPPLQTVLVATESGVGPYQIKGIGESPVAPPAPAIANAIADAIGVRIRDLPITAEKVYQALREASNK